MAANKGKEKVIFHSNANTIEDGEIYNVNTDANIMNIDFTTTKSGTDEVIFTAIFEGKVVAETDWKAFSAFNLKTLDVGSQATTQDVYQIDVTAWSYIRVRLSSIANGSITVIGKAVG